MNRLQYIETIAGQANLRNRRKLKKIHISIEQQLKSKKSISQEEKLAFQRSVVGQMARMKRRAFQSPVILQADFYSDSDNPPGIQTMAKCYMDLLEKPVAKSEISRQSLLFRNDRQIKALIVRCHFGIGTPQIRIKADSIARFRSDLALVRKISNRDFEQQESSYAEYSRIDSYQKQELFDDDDWDSYPDGGAKLRGFIQDKDEFVDSQGEELYEALLLHYQRSAQEEFLKGCGYLIQRSVTNLLTPPIHFANPEFADGFRSSINKMVRDTMFVSPISLPLMHTPLQEGDTKKFKAKAKEAFANFRQKNRLLFPLRCQVEVTILFVPPERKEDKDLDNLARLVVPFVHDELRPPSTLFHAFNLRKNAKEQAGFSPEQIQRFSRVPKYSVSGYQVFELPRIESDPPEGLVYIGLGFGENQDSLWTRVDDFIDRWQESVERY